MPPKPIPPELLALRRHNVMALFLRWRLHEIAQGLPGEDRAFAARLGITGAQWSRVKSGTPVGSKLARQFEQADRGTIFLDEIGELPLSMQTKLLRTLQEGTLVRLGGKRELRINVRLVAATNRDLAHEVALGAFREDLYYRLNVIPIQLPALRERSTDIHALAIHFLNRFNQENQRNVNLSSSALHRLQAHSWPGNIRELANLIERMVLLGDKAVLEAVDIERFLPRASPAEALRARAIENDRLPRSPATGSYTVRPYLPAGSHALSDLQEALRQQAGNRSRAAQALGLTLRQFNYRMLKLDGKPAPTQSHF